MSPAGLAVAGAPNPAGNGFVGFAKTDGIGAVDLGTQTAPPGGTPFCGLGGAGGGRSWVAIVA